MTIRYIPYQPEPVTGQALLSNFNRVLKYKGSNDLESRIVRGMPLYEAELVETVGQADSGNMVFRGDCISTCAYLRDKGIKVDLVYIDPPFASGADYAKKVYLRRNPKIAEVIEKARAELDLEEFRQFEEKMYGDIWDKEKYLSWMYENLLAIRSVMSDTASIYVHLDWHVGHYVKVLLDEIFGEDKFRNEIIWHYADYMQGNATNALPKKHDTIFFYTMSDEYYYNRVKVPLDEPVKRNKVVWNSETKKLEVARDENGKIIYETFNEKYLDSVWDIGQTSVTRITSSEFANYPTQKPSELLRRIIEGSSKEGMIVADFFGGSGSTALNAAKLNRRFIHGDVGLNSIQLTRDRLREIGSAFDVIEIRDGISLYRNPVQTMEKLKYLISGLKNEDSLDKYWEGYISDPRYGMVPVYVPNLEDPSSRLLDEVLMKRILYEAIPELADLPSVKKVIVYYIDVSDMDEINEMISKDKELNVEIEFRDLKDILDDVSLEDEMDYSIKEDHSKIDGGFVIDINKFYSDAVIRRINSFNLKSAQNDKKGKFKPITISDNGLELIEYVSLDCTKDDGVWNSDAEIKIEYTSKLTVDGKKTDNYWNGKIYSTQKPLRIKVRNICGDETIFKIE